jgi:hypothetical protein
MVFGYCLAAVCTGSLRVAVSDLRPALNQALVQPYTDGSYWWEAVLMMQRLVCRDKLYENTSFCYCWTKYLLNAWCTGGGCVC